MKVSIYMKNSLVSIQLLRAIAAWLVVFHHYHQLFSIQHLNYNSQFGYFGIDIFFVISGFIMFNSLSSRQSSAKEFFLRRLLRIVPSYWFYTLLMILLSWIYVEEFAYTDWNLTSLLSSIFFIINKNPGSVDSHVPLLTVGWTLNFEMFFYVCLSVCIFIFGRLCFWACSFVLITLPLFWDNYWLYSWQSTKLLFEFVLGIMLGYSYLRMKDVAPRRLFVLGMTLILLATQYPQLDIQIAGSGIFSWERFFLAFLLVSSALCFEPVLSKISHKVLQFLKHLGDISYSTYLVHPLVIGVFLHYAGYQDSLSGELFLMTATSLAILAISHLSFYHIEMRFLKTKTFTRAVSSTRIRNN